MTVERRTSRDLNDAEPALRERWLWLLDRYATLYPSDPLPQISCTYRDRPDQDAAMLRGASKLPYPKGTHNVYPSLACDFFFTESGRTSYRTEWVDRVCDLAESVGLFSGRKWGFDRPHIALVEKRTQWPVELPPLPEVSTRVEKAPVFVFNAPEPTVFEGEAGSDLLVRFSPKTGRVDARFDQPASGTTEAHRAGRELNRALWSAPSPSPQVLSIQGAAMPVPERQARKLAERVARASDVTPNYSMDDKEAITKYVTIIGNVVTILLTLLVSFGIVQMTDLAIEETAAAIGVAASLIGPVVVSICAGIARDKTNSQATTDKLLADQKETLKSDATAR